MRRIKREAKKTIKMFIPAARSCSLSLGDLYVGIAWKQRSQKKSNPLQFYMVVVA